MRTLHEDTGRAGKAVYIEKGSCQLYFYLSSNNVSLRQLNGYQYMHWTFQYGNIHNIIPINDKR